jgi:DNA repair protein RadC
MSFDPHYLGHRKRLKERFLRDRSGLADYELLELLLSYGLPRRDTKPLAKRLLSKFGSLKGVMLAKPHELRATSGVGQGLQTFFEVWQEYWARSQSERLQPKQVITGPEAIAEVARYRIGFAAEESFWVVLVDNKNRLLLMEEVGQGTVDQANVYPRDIIGMALEHKASGLVLLHNHPGGDPRPSSQDRDLTARIESVAGSLGLRVLDHIILAEESYFSFQSEGLI